MMMMMMMMMMIIIIINIIIVRPAAETSLIQGLHSYDEQKLLFLIRGQTTTYTHFSPAAA